MATEWVSNGSKSSGISRPHTCSSRVIVRHGLFHLATVAQDSFPSGCFREFVRNGCSRRLSWLPQIRKRYSKHALHRFDNDMLVVAYSLHTQRPHGQEAEGEVERGQAKINPQREPAVFSRKPFEPLGKRKRRLGAARVLGCLRGLFVALEAQRAEAAAERCSLAAQDEKRIALEGLDREV